MGPPRLLRHSHRDGLGVAGDSAVPHVTGCHELTRPATGSHLRHVLVDLCSSDLTGPDVVHRKATSGLVYSGSSGFCAIVPNNLGTLLCGWLGRGARHTQTHHNGQSNHHGPVRQIPTMSSPILRKSTLLVLLSSSQASRLSPSTYSSWFIASTPSLCPRFTWKGRYDLFANSIVSRPPRLSPKKPWWSNKFKPFSMRVCESRETLSTVGSSDSLTSIQATWHGFTVTE